MCPSGGAVFHNSSSAAGLWAMQNLSFSPTYILHTYVYTYSICLIGYQSQRIQIVMCAFAFVFDGCSLVADELRDDEPATARARSSLGMEER